MLDRMSQGLADAVKCDEARRTSQPSARWSRTSTELLSSGARATSRRRPRSTSSSPSTARSSRARATLDDVIEQLADRMAAMQSLLRSLSPEQRAELQDTIDALLRDDRLKWDLAQLAANLDQLLPGGLGERVRFSGDQPLGLESALDQLGRLQALDRLEAQLDGVGGPGRPRRDRPRRRPRPARAGRRPRPRRARGPGRRRLERAGYLERDGDRLELTPRGSRRIGQKVLDDLFARLRRDAFGGHRLDRTGPRRRARGDVEAVRVRRPVPPRPAGARWRTRCCARRTRRRGGAPGAGRPAAPRRLRGLPDGAARRRPRPSCSST